MYGIAVFVIGIIMYTFDLFGKTARRIGHHGEISEIWNLYLCTVGIIIISWLLYDITKYLQMMREFYDDTIANDNRSFRLVEGQDGELIISIPLVKSKSKKLPEYYCFSTGRHSGSFFLKIGAAVFCIGQIIHMLIAFAKQCILLYTPHPGDTTIACGNPLIMVNSLMQAIYVFLQLWMIFQYSNVIVNRSKRIARVAFMHCIASSLCFWIHTIINETVDSVVTEIIKKPNETALMMTRAIKSCSDYPHSSCIDSNETSHFSLDLDCYISNQCGCLEKNAQALNLFEFIPYLYPFGIEFSILVAGVWYIMWDNIGNVAEHKQSLEFTPSPRRSIDSGTGKMLNDGLYLYADCHAAIKGVFVGKKCGALDYLLN